MEEPDVLALASMIAFSRAYPSVTVDIASGHVDLARTSPEDVGPLPDVPFLDQP
jgi:hypothetical protein